LVTIELTNVSEQKALDVVLRRVSGYVAAQRVVAVPNASVFDRILVMPARMAPMPATTALVAAKVTAAPAPQAWSGQASTVQASSASAQVTFASRHAMETINPLEYKVPIQLLQGAVPKSAPQPQSGVPVPGMIVRPPRQPGSPK